MILTSSLTLALSTGFSGRSLGVFGKYSSKNSRIGMDCLMTMGAEPEDVTVRVGTEAEGLVSVYSGEVWSDLRRWM